MEIEASIEKKYFAGIALMICLLVLVFAGIVSATDQTCDESQVIFNISANSNAHASVYNQGSYGVGICFDDYFNGTGDGVHSCNGNNFILNLSAETNAHAERYDYGNYPVGVCYGGGITCEIEDSPDKCKDVAGASNVGSIIVSLSDETNAHLYLSNKTGFVLCCADDVVNAICDYDGNCAPPEDEFNCPSDCGGGGGGGGGGVCDILADGLIWEDEGGDEITTAKKDDIVTAVVKGNEDCVNLESFVMEEITGTNREIDLRSPDLIFHSKEVRVNLDLEAEGEAQVGDKFRFEIEFVSATGNEFINSPVLEIENCPPTLSDLTPIMYCFDYDELDDAEKYCGCNDGHDCDWFDGVNGGDGGCRELTDGGSCFLDILSAEACGPDNDFRTILLVSNATNGDGNIAPDPDNNCNDAGCGANAEPCSQTVLCPRSALLPFFSFGNVVGIIVLVVVGYFVWEYLRKKKRVK